MQNNEHVNVYIIREEERAVEMTSFVNEDFGRILKITLDGATYEVALAYVHESARNRRKFLGHRGIGYRV